MKQLFIAMYLVAMAGILVSHLVLPAEVAIHFGGGGGADGWAPKLLNTVVFAVMDTVLFVVILLAPRLTFALPPRYVNLPNREHWLAGEHRDRAVAIFANLMYELGAAFMAFMAVINVLTLDANLSQPVRLNEPVFLAFVVVFLLYTVVWCVRLMRAFRVPDQQRRVESR